VDVCLPTVSARRPKDRQKRQYAEDCKDSDEFLLLHDKFLSAFLFADLTANCSENLGRVGLLLLCRRISGKIRVKFLLFYLNRDFRTAETTEVCKKILLDKTG
jgi:hypothetical protein